MTADKKRWDALHAAYAKKSEALFQYELEIGRKYGHNFSPSWLSATERNRLDRLREAKSVAGDKIIDLIVRVSPRGEAWLSGVPSVWLREELTWEDATRPANEPLSVIVPGAYGYPDGYMKEVAMKTEKGPRGLRAQQGSSCGCSGATDRQARLVDRLLAMGATKHDITQDVLDQTRELSVLQSLFFAMSSRRANAHVIGAAIGRDPMARLARQVGGVVKSGYLIGDTAYVLPKA